MTQAVPALRARDIILLLLVAAMWGSNNVAAHLVSQEINPLIAAGIRFVITTAVLLPWLAIPRRQLPAMLLVALIAGPVHFGLIYSGFAQSNNIGALTVVMQMWVPISTVLAIFMLHEKLNYRQALGLACALIGIVIMCFDPHLLDDLHATWLSLGGTACWALTMALVRRVGTFNGLSLQAWMALLSGPLLLLAGNIVDPLNLSALTSLSLPFWLLTLFAVFGSGIFANATVFNIVRKYSVSQTTPVLLCAPIFAMICGVVFVGEKIGVQEIAGATLVLASVLIIVRDRASA